MEYPVAMPAYQTPVGAPVVACASYKKGGVATVFDFFFDFIQWKPTDTRPRDRCGRAQLVLLWLKISSKVLRLESGDLPSPV